MLSLEEKYKAISTFQHIAVNDFLVQVCCKGKWYQTYYKKPPIGDPELAKDVFDAMDKTIERAIKG